MSDARAASRATRRLGSYPRTARLNELSTRSSPTSSSASTTTGSSWSPDQRSRSSPTCATPRCTSTRLRRPEAATTDELLEALGEHRGRLQARHRPPGPPEAHAGARRSGPTTVDPPGRAGRGGPARPRHDDDVTGGPTGPGPRGLGASSTSRPAGLATTSSPRPGPARHPKVGHPGTLDPDATGVLLARRRPGHPAAALPAGAAQDLHRRGRARRRDLDARRGRRGHRAPTTWRRSTLGRRASGRRRPHRRHPAGAADGVGCRSAAGGCTSWPGRRRGRARGRPVTVHRFEVGRAGGPGVFPVACQCSSGTYMRSLAADLGAALGGGAHLRAPAAHRGRDRSASTRRCRSRRCRPSAAAPAGRGAARLPVGGGRTRTWPPRCGHGKVLDRRRAGADRRTVPGRCSTATGTLLAVYERHRGADRSSPAWSWPRVSDDSGAFLAGAGPADRVNGGSSTEGACNGAARTRDARSPTRCST